MNTASKIVALTVLTFSFPVLAECPFPKAPAVMPKGKSASEPEMLSAMVAFQAYNQEVNAFGACLDEQSKANSDRTQLMRLKTLQNKKIDAAVDELRKQVKLFNEQVRIFKAR